MKCTKCGAETEAELGGACPECFADVLWDWKKSLTPHDRVWFDHKKRYPPKPPFWGKFVEDLDKWLEENNGTLEIYYWEDGCEGAAIYVPRDVGINKSLDMWDQVRNLWPGEKTLHLPVFRRNR